MMKNAETIRAFLTAGRAIFTLTSTKTGKSFTYRVARPRDNEAGPLFANLLTGPSNVADYTYLGCVRMPELELHPTRSTAVSPNSPGFRALEWYLQNIGDPRVEFRHEGRCGRCGRVLTVPSSIDSGLGPECAEKI